jgi:hypothetical protein
MSFDLPYLRREFQRSKVFHRCNKGVIDSSNDQVLPPDAVEVATSHNKGMRHLDEIYSSVLVWFRDAYPSDCLEVGSVSWEVGPNDRIYVLWRTTSENAAVLMKMLWS